jgi:hypothetical protein
MRVGPYAALTTTLALVGLTAPLSVAHADSWPVVRTAHQVARDVSPPLRDLAAAAGPIVADHEHKIDRVRPIPRPQVTPGQERPDGALQSEQGPAAKIIAGVNFAGVGQGDYGFSPDAAPPDTNGVVGATQYVQYVNESVAVFDKISGAVQLGPVKGHTIWAGFKSDCAKHDDGDPIAQYDKAAKRWILSQFFVSGKKFLECVAVSQTSDATGAYNRYAFSYGTTDFNDYPKIGVWPDGYYVTYNIFHGQSFAGGKVCAFDRTAMLAGNDATQQCVQLSSQFGGLLPSDLDGSRQPPAGSPNFIVTYDTNKLDLFKFHVDWANPANTDLEGPTIISVPSFTPACGGFGACMKQKGTTQTLDSLADRPMYRLAYRNFGDHESLVVNQSVEGASGSASSGVRWYEVRDPNGTPTLFQSGTYEPTSKAFRWMGSAAQDKFGNMAVAYSYSSANDFPAIRFAGRLAGDAAGKLEAEQSILEGTGSQINTANRWGDYSALTVDPEDDCTFYFTSEYLKTTGSFNWSTRIASFKFPKCKTK